MKYYISFLCLVFSMSLTAQLDFSKKNHIEKKLLKKMDSTVKAGTFERIKSIIIAQDGKVIFEEYYNGANQSTGHNTRSATKTMATLLTGIAIKKGYIQSEKDKIFKYLRKHKPIQNTDKRKDAITIEDLLTMSSALECSDDNSQSRGNEEKMYLIEDWTQFFLDLPIRSYTFRNQPKDEPYGRSFSYCTAGAATMSEVIQSALGIKTHEFAKKELFNPLEITNYKLHFTPLGFLNTAGGSEYTSRDLLKLIQLCANKGIWKGQQIIPETFLKKATTPKAQPWEGMKYGYLFWIKDFGSTKKYNGYAMAGNGGQKVVAVPQLNATVVITTTNYNNRKAHAYTDTLMNNFIVPTLQRLKN